jgi:hypothetical protein
VAGALGANGAGALGTCGGRAERARAVRGRYCYLVGQLEEPLNRPVLRAGQLFGAGRVDEVGAGDRSHEKGASGEDSHGLGVVEQQEGEVLVAVPGGAQGTQPEAPEVQLVSVA